MRRRKVAEAGRPKAGQDIVIMTGPAGAGRSTAIGALEDLGFEAIDNLPLSLMPRLFAGPPLERPVVVGIDPRNREFGVARLIALLGEIEAAVGRRPVLVFLDCEPGTLVRRYSETRRRHPLSPRETALVGIERELALLAPLRERADVLIDTSAMTPHDLRAEMARQFGGEEAGGALAVSLVSFAYKRGAPRGIDMLIDARFLQNPHWEADPSYAPFFARLVDLLRFLLPAYRAEGKSYFGLGLGCTGGRHRSVVLVEALAKTLAADGWQVSIRHRDLERVAGDASPGVGVSTS